MFLLAKSMLRPCIKEPKDLGVRLSALLIGLLPILRKLGSMYLWPLLMLSMQLTKSIRLIQLVTKLNLQAISLPFNFNNRKLNKYTYVISD